MITPVKVISQSPLLGQDILSERSKVVLPFEYLGGFIILDVKFHNLIPLKFIFDTGATNTILFNKYYADIFDMPYTDTIGVKGADIYNEVEGYIIRNGIFQLPDIKSTVTRDFIALSDNYVKLQANLGIQIDGILGTDFFKRLTIKIDYCKKRLTIIDPDQLSLDRTWSTTPYTSQKGKVYIPVHVDLGHKTADLNLLLDTGANTSVILYTGTAAAIAPPDSTTFGYLGTGLSGDILGHMGIVNNLTIGGNSFSGLVANFQAIHEDSTILDFILGDGLVGNAILSRFDITIDYIHQQLYLRPNKHFHKKQKFNNSGLLVHALGQDLDQYTVSHVLPHSPAAEAGILVGDIITKLGRCKVNRYPLSELHRKFEDKEGKVIRLTLKRGQEHITKTITLRQFLRPNPKR